MRIALCDENADSLRELAELITAIAAEEEIPCETICYPGGDGLLAAIETGTAHDAYFLDPGREGIELAAALRKRCEEPLVLVSDCTELAPCGYEVGAVRYLLKPLVKDKLREALMLCCRQRKGRQEVMLPTAHGMRPFRLSDIVYAETWGRELRAWLSDGQQELLPLRISDLQAMLSQQRFILCHRTILVNLDYVLYVRYCELELKTGGILPVSKYRLNAVREGLFAYRRT
ncbi:MAG: LytR/AlgR family response regulator transcription factor [Aristaeellaceae bacterium]